MTRRLLLNIFRLYFRYFPIRKGKIPILLLIDKTGLTKNYFITTKFDKEIYINLNLDDWIQKQVFYFGRYEIEKNETLFWQNLIQESQIIFDIGANIGYYSLMAAIRVGKLGKVYAFEPVTTTYVKLQNNILLNKFNNIYPEKFAISNSIGKIELFVADEKSTGSSSISNHVNYSGKKESVNTNTIDNYVTEKEINKIDVVKIDVEGCEFMVIEGMLESMKSFKPLILTEVLDERLKTVHSSKEKLYELFQRNNYNPFEIINKSTVKRIQKPIEGGLIIFKHTDSNFPHHISIS